MEVSVGLDPGVKHHRSIFSSGDKHSITLSPQITNITRSDPNENLADFSMRDFYWGQCVNTDDETESPLDKDDVDHCNKVIIHNMPLVNGYPAEFIIIVNDHRAAFTSKHWSWNMEPVKVNVKIYQTLIDEDWKAERPKSERVIQDFTYHIDIEKNW